jgi:hypothetical protein
MNIRKRQLLTFIELNKKDERWSWLFRQEYICTRTNEASSILSG